MATDLPRRFLRPNMVLDLPRVKPDAEGRINPGEFEHYSRTIDEWARTVSDRSRVGIWNPELSAVTTTPTLGTDPIIAGDWYLENDWATIRFLITFGTAGAGAGSGIYSITNLPFRIDHSLGAGGWPEGQVHLRDVGAASRHWTLVTSGETALRMVDSNGVEAAHNVPWAWGNNDNMRGWARYRITGNHPPRGI